MLLLTEDIRLRKAVDVDGVVGGSGLTYPSIDDAAHHIQLHRCEFQGEFTDCDAEQASLGYSPFQGIHSRLVICRAQSGVVRG